MNKKEFQNETIEKRFKIVFWFIAFLMLISLTSQIYMKCN